jgi:uracil-DNA glycosylase family 4
MNSLGDLNLQVMACRLCPRLVAWREQVAFEKRKAYRQWEYWGKPVPGFGDPQARLLIVGLAPGAHGSNRTGRMFTGDSSGDFLFPALHRAGFASQPGSVQLNDDLTLKDAYITAVGRCAPPDNKPTPAELSACRPYLLAELELLSNVQGIVALGRIAYDILCAIDPPIGTHTFAHSSFTLLTSGKWLLASYHPSRQNTQTGRLTTEMFDDVWSDVRRFLK